MELDPRQGELFLTLLKGGKPEFEYPNYRSKFDAVDPQGCDTLNQESKIPQSETSMEQGRQQSSG